MSDLFSHVGSGLLHLVLPALATVLSGLAVSFLQKKAAQAGIELTQAQTDLVKREVTHAVQAVEELSNRKAASQVDRAMTGSEKTNAATAIAAKALPNTPISDITQMIDTVLPEVRAKLAPGLAAVVAAVR